MKKVAIINPTNDRIYVYIDNGVFFDGRLKTLKAFGSKQSSVASTTLFKKCKDSKDSSIVKFCVNLSDGRVVP